MRKMQNFIMTISATIIVAITAKAESSTLFWIGH
jgi:hypothetical protein